VAETNEMERAIEQESPRLESWFKVLLSSFIPVAAAFVLPPAGKIIMFVISGVLMVTGFVMLIMHERKKG
jgi:hypothetical protein